MSHSLLIEAEGQPVVTVHLEPTPEIIFQDAGVQGPPGPPVVEGDGIKVVGDVVHVDIASLTFAP